MSTPEHDPVEEDGAYWYFLSYSEQKEHLSRVARFHRDLESEVKGLLGRVNAAGGFMDVEDITPSARWRPVIWNSARKTRCLVALYCTDYFQSDWCAREWAVVSRRVNLYEAEGGNAHHVIPLAWRRGRQRRPSGVDVYQYVEGAVGGVYEKRGLFHLVPPDGVTADKEYWDIVHKVADLIEAAVMDPPIPVIPEEEARTVVPLFGRRMLRPVDIVVSYAEVGPDADLGMWMMYHLRSVGYEVDKHVLSPTSDGTIDVLRNSLRRARKVILVLSEHYLTTGDMSDTALDEAMSDESSDWQRLFPVVPHAGPQRPWPTRLGDTADVRIGGPDEAASLETLLRLAAAPDGRAQRAPAYPGPPHAAPPPTVPGTAGSPGFPGASVPTVSDLVDALEKAVSVKEPTLRRVWLTETGLDVSSLNLAYPPRTLLFEIARVCREQTGGYWPLAHALQKLEPHSPSSRAVRDALTGMTLPPPTTDTTTG